MYCATAMATATRTAKKAIGLDQQNKVFHVHHPFLYIFFYEVFYFTFFRGRDFLILLFFCCRASAGSRPYSWSIWDFWFDGSMVPRFDGHLWLQRCAISGLLSCRACFSLRTGATRHFVLLSCKICAEIVVYRMLAVFLNGLNGKSSSRRIVRNNFSVYFFYSGFKISYSEYFLSHRLLSR